MTCVYTRNINIYIYYYDIIHNMYSKRKCVIKSLFLLIILLENCIKIRKYRVV